MIRLGSNGRYQQARTGSILDPSSLLITTGNLEPKKSFIGPDGARSVAINVSRLSFDAGEQLALAGAG
jgi:hypothetical protein